MNGLLIVHLKAGAVVLALYAALGGSVTAPQLNDKLQQAIKKVAADLKNANGAALVVSGSNDVNVQTIVNAINNAIGAYGKTIDWSVPLNYRQGVDKDMADLGDDDAKRTGWCITDLWC